MTAAGTEALAAEARDLEARIARLGTPDAPADPMARAELERRVLRLCEAAPALPPVEARRLADALAHLVAALDAAADRLRAAGATGEPDRDSARAGADSRRAAAAYGSAAGRIRRGS